MTTKIELYDRLSGVLPIEAARIIAEEMPTESDLATKADIAATQADIAGLDLKLADLKASMFRWQLAFFAPIWVATWGTLIALFFRT